MGWDVDVLVGCGKVDATLRGVSGAILAAKSVFDKRITCCVRGTSVSLLIYLFPLYWLQRRHVLFVRPPHFPRHSDLSRSFSSLCAFTR